MAKVNKVKVCKSNSLKIRALKKSLKLFYLEIISAPGTVQFDLSIWQPHSPTVKTESLSFHKDSDIHQCFLICILFLNKNRIYTHSGACLCTIDYWHTCAKYNIYMKYICCSYGAFVLIFQLHNCILYCILEIFTLLYIFTLYLHYYTY